MECCFNPLYKSIGESFVQHFYTLFDNCRNNEVVKQQLKALYHTDALLTFEGFQVRGPELIVEKFASIPVTQVARTFTKVDSQPTADGKIIVVVIGISQSDNDKPLPFLDSFILSCLDNKNFCIVNHIFRLLIHNVASEQQHQQQSLLRT